MAAAKSQAKRRKASTTPQPSAAAPAAPAAPAAGGGSAARGLPRQFWLINAIELVERGAYYGMTAILFLYFVGLGYSTAFVGMMSAVLVFFAYFFPVVGGVLAERSGFRRSMLAAFAVVAVGYVALGSTVGLAALGDFALLPGVLLVGLGAGLFKPIAAAVIAQTTTTEQRGFGFTIYYAGINIGGFLGPLLIGLFVPEAFYQVVFLAAAGFAVVNLGVLLLVYRDVQPGHGDKSVRQALAQLAEVRRDPWFVALLVFYSGLWFMYAQQLYLAPLYFADFVTGMPAWFTPPLVATINPGVIILVGPILGRVLSRYPSLPVVIGGIFVYALGSLLTGFDPAAMLFLAGITLASAGEVVAQPNFLSYVSKVAPQGKLALYMGYGFVPIGVGLVAGNMVGSVLYEHFAETLRQPALFWGAAAAVGAASLGGLLVVNLRMAARQPDARALQGTADRVLRSRVAPIGVLALVPLLLVASAAPGVMPAQSDRLLAAQAPGLGAVPLEDVRLAPLEGTTAEGDASDESVALATAARNLTFTLRWTDEPASGPAGPLPGAAPASNAPDRFALTVELPDGTTRTEEAENPAGGEGEVVVAMPDAPAGTYRVRIELADAGNVQVPPGVTLQEDTGNAWTLEVAYRVRAPG